MNRKGIIRIVEASIAILIVASVLFMTYTRGITEDSPDYSENARDILEELANDIVLRDAVLSANNGDVTSAEILEFIENRKQNYLSASATLCLPDEACGQSSYVGDVFSAERIISTNVNSGSFEPKKIRLFLWEEQ